MCTAVPAPASRQANSSEALPPTSPAPAPNSSVPVCPSSPTPTVPAPVQPRPGSCTPASPAPAQTSSGCLPPASPAPAQTFSGPLSHDSPAVQPPATEERAGNFPDEESRAASLHETNPDPSHADVSVAQAARTVLALDTRRTVVSVDPGSVPEPAQNEEEEMNNEGPAQNEEEEMDGGEEQENGNRQQSRAERAAMRDKAKRYLRENYPLLNQNFSVLASDARCATALAALRAQVESRSHVVRPEVHEGSTFYAPRRYLHRFARMQDAVHRFGRELWAAETDYERENGDLVLVTSPHIEPVEGETVLYDSEKDE